MRKILIVCLLFCLESPAVFAQSSVFKVQGTVKDTKGKGIAGVVVNDGVDFTRTDNNGNWSFDKVDTCVSKFISISTPADYEFNTDKGLARFYQPIRKAIKTTTSFVLKKRKAPLTRFCYIAISDPQVRDEREMKRWKTETVKDLAHTADSISKTKEVVGMTLGDLVFDRMDLYPEYSASLQGLPMTVFQTIGNHDFDKRYQDLHNMRRGSAHFAEEQYFRFFGPTDYSFNIGKIHVIVMKSLNYVGHRKYIESVTDEQLAWLEKDLSYVPKGTTVFLNMHAAGWNAGTNDGNIRNAEEIVNTLKGYNTHYFCGHTHYMQSVPVSPSFYQHNSGAACGAWWAGSVSQDGTPNGYLIVDVDGNDVKWHFKPTNGNVSQQMRLYAPGTFRRAKKYFVANVWDYDPQCKVEWYADDKDMGGMERFDGTDEIFIREQNAINKDAADIITPHLFRCIPSKDVKSLKVIFTNRFGEKYQESLELAK